MGRPAQNTRPTSRRQDQRHDPATSALTRLHRREANRATRTSLPCRRRPGHRRRSRREDHMARAWTARRLPDRQARRPRRRRRLRPPRGATAHRRVRRTRSRHHPGGGTQRRLDTGRRPRRSRRRHPPYRTHPRAVPPGPQGRSHRHPRRPGRDHARLRAQLRERPLLVHPDRALWDRRCGGDVAVRRAGPSRPGRRGRTDRGAERHLSTIQEPERTLVV